MTQNIVRNESGHIVGYERSGLIFRLTQLVWFIVGILESVIALRFLLRILAANPAAGFTDFVYRLSTPLVNPFLNVFRPMTLENGGVLEWGSLIAILVYYLIGRAITGLIIMSRTDRGETAP